MTDRLIGKYIHIRGIVQGVGFRPLIYNYAQELGLSGWIKNSSKGVEIEVHGPADAVSNFIQKIKASPPPRSRIDSVHETLVPYAPGSGFQIVDSTDSTLDFLPISPDLATCPDCLRELFDPNDRRHRYPFINCVNCGPRFTIIQSIPYDRPRTTMSEFSMCPECQSEYEDPSNRRFHAQPIACPKCGPVVSFYAKNELRSSGEDALQEARKLISAGGIVAFKSLGGYQLACDAFNSEAVCTLRERKKRIQKPFALMAANTSVIADLCLLDQAEAELLSCTQSPVVLLRRKCGTGIADEVAPAQNFLGVMLPYTPLHHLLLESQDGFPSTLVMTSGNMSEEPIAYEDPDAFTRLTHLADGFLTHDRVIHMRTDDSVVRQFNGASYPVRRARGYAPEPIAIPELSSSILAAGSDLKNTFCVARSNYAFISHHIGDLENFETFTAYESAIKHFLKLFNIKPQGIGCDLHPDYFSSKYARELACQIDVPIVEIQHHHAHLASCLADNHHDDAPAIGLMFDGTGYGLDGKIWGGEVLVGDFKSFERRFHLEYMSLPGGDAAIHHVARIGSAYLLQACGDLSQVEAVFPKVDLEIITKQIQHKINAPYTSSMGRLFDALSSILGICAISTYDGQAAIELEMKADPDETGHYDMVVAGEEIMVTPLLIAILNDLKDQLHPGRISAKFHNSLVQMSVQLCETIRKQEKIKTVALSGGVWQNHLLLENMVHALRKSNFEVLWHHQVPANDGGLSLGQIMIAANRFY